MVCLGVRAPGSKSSSYSVLHETRVWFIKQEDYTLGLYSANEKLKKSTLYFLRFDLMSDKYLFIFHRRCSPCLSPTECIPGLSINGCLCVYSL